MTISPEIQKLCTGAIARGICRSQRDGHYCICEMTFGMNWQGEVREEKVLSPEEALARCNADVIYADMALAGYNQMVEELSRFRKATTAMREAAEKQRIEAMEKEAAIDNAWNKD